MGDVVVRWCCYTDDVVLFCFVTLPFFLILLGIVVVDAGDTLL